MTNYIGLCELCSSPEPCNQCLGLPLLKEKIKTINSDKTKHETEWINISDKTNKATLYNMIKSLKENK